MEKLLTIGLCTVERHNENYLDKTVESIIKTTSEEEKAISSVILLDCNITVDTPMYILGCILNCGRADWINVKSRCISRELVYFHNSPKINISTDSNERFLWRAKQCLDYAELFELLRITGTTPYYLIIEDDIFCSSNFIHKIIQCIKEHENENWLTMKFCPHGFIGYLFKKEHLQEISSFLSMFYQEMPVDLLIEEYFKIKQRMRKVHKNPYTLYQYPKSLFLHIGNYSSLQDKIQPIQARHFEE